MDTFETAKRGREIPQRHTRASQNKHLQAAIVIQVDVQRCHHLPGVIVLQIEQLLHEMGPVVIVYQRQRGGDGLIVALECVQSERSPEELADCLAPRGERAFPDEAIERLKQIGFQRNGKAREIGHVRPPHGRQL